MRKYITILIILLCTLMLNGCGFFGPGMADYNYKLSGNYVLYHAGLTYVSQETNQIIDRGITGIAWNKDFILAEQTGDTPSKYWIIDVKNDKKYGPLDTANYDKKKNELEIDQNLKLENPEKYKYLEGKK